MTTENNDLYAKDEETSTDMVTLAIRLPRETREAFNNLCKSKGVEVSKVLRRFIERELKASK